MTHSTELLAHGPHGTTGVLTAYPEVPGSHPVPESMAVRTNSEVAFEAARQIGDRTGMAAAVRETWREIEVSARLDRLEDDEPRPDRVLPNDFSNLEYIDDDAVRAAMAVRDAYADECMAWERAHRMRRRPRTYGVQKTSDTVQRPGGKVTYHRMDPKLVYGEAESGVNPTPVIIVGGFGTGPFSTAKAAKEICRAGVRQVIRIEERRPKRVRPGTEPIHQDIDAYYDEAARDLLAVVEKEANGDPNYQVDLVLQSGAVHGLVAALERITQQDRNDHEDGGKPLPLWIRQIAFDSASGSIGDDQPKALMGRFAKDAIVDGTPSYMRDPRQLLRYVWKFFTATSRNTGHNADGVRAITRSHTDRDALRRARANGVIVRDLRAHADPVFPVDLVYQNIKLDEVGKDGRFRIGTADSIAERIDPEARHGALLFNQDKLGHGALAVLQMLEGYRYEGDLASLLTQKSKESFQWKRLIVPGAIALIGVGISLFVPGTVSGHEGGGFLKLIHPSGGEVGGAAHPPTGGEGNPPLTGTEGFHPPVVDSSGSTTGGEVAHTPTTTIVAGEGQTVWQNFANVFGADQAMTKILEAGHAYAMDPNHEGVTFGVHQGSGAVYFDVNGTRIWDAAEITKMLASAL